MVRPRLRPPPEISRLAVHHDARVYDALLHGRGQSKDGAGGIAAGVGYQIGLGYLIPVKLRQAVGGFLQVLRAGVGCLVPGLILGHALQAEVGGYVHDFDAVLQERNARFRAGLMGQCRKDQVQAAAEFRLDFQV